MKKMKLVALFLAIIMAFACLTPLMSFAAEVDDGIEETYTAAPYMLRTQSVGEKTNKVKVWLELNPTIAEGIAAYQIALQLESKEGTINAGRKASLAFDSALSAAEIKETRFDEETQTMKVYVAGTKNLVQTGVDASGNLVNTLPIGTLTVEALKDKAENSFKVVLFGKTGSLKTVGLDCNVNDAALIYGTPEKAFEIPVDGTVYAIPSYTLTLKQTGNGTVKAFKVNADGTETAYDGNPVSEDTLIRLDVAAASGNNVSEVKLTDTATGESVALSGDYKFVLSSDMEVSVIFAKTVVNYSLTLKKNGNGVVKAYKLEGNKEVLISNGTVTEGSKVRIDAKADNGYKVEKVVVTDKSGTKTLTGDYSFVVSSDATVTVTFEKASTPTTDPEKPDEPSKPACSCKCHKTGIAGFFWKISNFFNKLFKVQSKRMCACGDDHWKK